MNKKKESKVVPNVRFKGFTDDWKQRKFSQGVSEIGDGLHGTPTYCDNGNVFFINGNNLVDGKIVINSETKTVDETQQSLSDKDLDDNTILLSINGTIGNLAYYSGEKLMLGKSAAYIKVSAFDIKFVYTYLQTPSVHSYFMNSLTGTTIKNLGLKAIREMKLDMPQDIDEQKKIGDYFSTLDHLITLHQRKIDKFKNLKKAMLEKMFPKKGSVIPEIRFNGVANAWEQRKLGELAFFNPKEKLPDVFEYVDLESVVGIEMLSHRTEEKATAPSRAQRLAHTGDLFYQTVRPYQKNNYLFEKSEKHYVFSTGYSQLRPLVDGYFLLSLVQNGQFVKTVLDNCTGTNYPAINANDLAEIDVFYPKDKHEQHQIGEYFRHLDHLITLHQRKIDKIKNMKKAMLDQMFI